MIDLISVCNPEQLKAFENFERLILDNIGDLSKTVFGESKVFGVSIANYLEKSGDKLIEKHIDKFEQLVYPIMQENGTVNGKALNAFLQEKKPAIYKLIHIPNEDFLLSDLIEQVMKSIKQIF